jgi:glycosyltransferase involved in cell wall biosynthesis
MTTDTFIVVAALDEAERIGATLAALALAFPGAPVWVADDGSSDATPELARAAGATVIRSAHGAPRPDGGAPRPDGVVGKGQAMTAGVQAALSSVDFLNFFDGVSRARIRARGADDLEDSVTGRPEPSTGEPFTTGKPSSTAMRSAAEPIVVLCDGDLGESARELTALVDAVRRGDGDLAVAAFATRAGGGFGLTLTFARWAIRRRCGLSTRAPISGQRAVRAGVMRELLPFAGGFGMEAGMTIDAVRAGCRVVEIDLDLAHRATGRTPAGFAHRARQLLDVGRVYFARR